MAAERSESGGRRQGCTGHSSCPAERHIHGCYADFGNCNSPAEHNNEPAAERPHRTLDGDGYRTSWTQEDLDRSTYAVWECPDFIEDES